MTKNLPHISNPIDDARSLINNANHRAWRAGHIDTAYELDKAVMLLRAALKLLEQIQQDYDFAHPSKIDTGKPGWDPSLMPPGVKSIDWDDNRFEGVRGEDDQS